MSAIEKNTVSAVNQLKNTGNITFVGNLEGSPRILFLGNSITRHGVKEEIGWPNDFGMAASSKENDYVHLVKKWMQERYPDTAVCICQGSEWEVNYRNVDWSFDRFESARLFNADIIVFRLIENVGIEEFEPDFFKKSVREFLGYLNPSGKAKVIITTGFWRHPGDGDLIKVAEEDGYPLADLGVLGDKDDMKALGLFWHEGVANHPGDKGMAAIAEEIEKIIEQFCIQ